FAAAVLTGDRSGLSRHTLDTMRASNLAHLLAISGLHMGLLTGFVFLVVRFGVAAVPWLALRTDGRKVAACVALVAAAGYLALSGGSVATQRAFVMAAVMLCAVLLDRRALTLRAVALAGVLILVFRPESLLSAGFQMSFAATTALVWVFSAIRDAKIGRAPKWAAPVLGLIISSAVAGLATGPVGAAHFNQVAQYGIVANLFAVPVMGFLVIPMAVLALCLSPLGLSWIGLWFMGLGCQWILGVAETVSTWPDATRAIIAPPGWVLPTIMLGCLWMILVRGGVKWAGLAPMAVAFLAWSEAERPPILISSSGALVGVLHADGRQLNKPRGDGFVARSWLENDGDHREQPESAWMGKGVFTADVGGVTVRQGTAARLRKDGTGCGGADILISPHAAEGDTRDCWVLDAKALKQTGSVALWPGSDGIEAIAANDLAGVRPWTGPSKPDAAKQTLLGNEQESGVFTTLLARLTDQ
ncbi:MAG: ComEC/Rec2 family competence protein, partial [Pseudomonadota bacterium]